MHKSILILAACYINILSLAAQKNQAITDFEKQNLLKNCNIGICIQKTDGTEVAALNKNKSFTPASVLKIVTTATAIELLGESHRYPTELIIDNNTLIIKGYGDPTLGSEHLYQEPKSFLNEWVSQIKKAGVSSINEICITDNYFGYQGTAKKWLREDLGNYYAAAAYGISVFDNTYKLIFNTMDVNSSPKIVRTEPHINNLAFINMLRLNNTGKDNGFIWGEPFSNTRTLTGDIPAKKTSFSIKGDIPDPGLLLGESLAETLSKEGYNISNVQTARKTYHDNFFSKKADNTGKNGRLIYTHSSPSLKEIIRIVNVKSNNHYSEHLIRSIGRTQKADIYSEPLQAGIEAVHNYWNSKQFDTSGLFMYDGCGLSPSNAVNPALMCELLRYMYTKSNFSEAFLQSFPKAGMEGTVRNFLKGTKLEGKVYVKSGSIAKVQCYSGYYINGEETYVFTVMINNFQNEERRKIVKAIENLLLEIF